MKEDKDFIDQRYSMVSTVKNCGITDQNVLKAMLKVPRHLFVSENLKNYAYINRPLPIDCSQTVSQPYIVAFMTQEAQLDNNSRVLEIGTGSGYQTSILAEICKEVFTIEVIIELRKQASKLLNEFGYNNVHIKYGDGYVGWAACAPFDAIIVTAAAPILPKNLLHQLKIGGRMIIPLNKGLDDQVLVKLIKTSQNDDYTLEELLDVRFVPMVKS